MMDRASFRALLQQQLGGVDAAVMVEMHLHGGESYFLRSVKQVRELCAICEIVPMHEWADGRDASAFIDAREVAVPYSTIARVAVSDTPVPDGHPVGFRGANGAVVNG